LPDRSSLKEIPTKLARSEEGGSDDEEYASLNAIYEQELRELEEMKIVARNRELEKKFNKPKIDKLKDKINTVRQQKQDLSSEGSASSAESYSSREMSPTQRALQTDRV